MKTTPSHSRVTTATILAIGVLAGSISIAAAAEANNGGAGTASRGPGDVAGYDPGRRDGPGGIAGNNPPADWAYVGVGPEPAWDTEGIQLLRGSIDDHDMSGGTLIHAADAGGGTAVDSWSAVIGLPFFFQVYGVPFDRFCVSKSGLLTFTLSVANTTTFINGSAGGWAQPEFQAPSQRVEDGGTTVIGGLYTGNDGKTYFGELELVSGSTNDPLGMPHPDLPNNTIAYFWGNYLPFSAKNIYMFVHGQAPNRQAWIVNAGHRKKGHLETYTAVVLEETSNRIFVVDMSTTTQAKNGFLTVGIQRDSAKAHQLALSPNVPVTGMTSAANDNSCYILRPYRRNDLVSGQGDSNLAQLDANISEWMEKWNMPGATVAVSQGGRLVFWKGYGFANVETGLQMQPFHRANIGSVSKVITTLSVLRLLELAAEASVPLSLDDLLYGGNGLLAAHDYEDNIINGIVKGLDDGAFMADSGLYWNTAYHSIRLRHLLTHTSGFAGGGNPDAAAQYFGIGQEDLTYSHIHRHFLDTKPLLSPPPGTAAPLDPGGFLLFPPPPPVAKYSNHAFGLCGHIVEAVGGIPFIDFTQDFIFAPLNLQITHSATHYSDLTPIDSKRYNYFTDGQPHQVSHFDGSRVYGAYGWKRGDLGTAAGGWVTTARDLVRLMCATDQLANQSDILQPASLNEMESVPYPTIDPNQAHGWRKTDSGKLGKDGENIFCSAYMAKYSSGINVAIVVNTGGVSGKVQNKCDEIWEMVKNAGIPATYDLFGGLPEGGL